MHQRRTMRLQTDFLKGHCLWHEHINMCPCDHVCIQRCIPLTFITIGTFSHDYDNSKTRLCKLIIASVVNILYDFKSRFHGKTWYIVLDFIIMKVSLWAKGQTQINVHEKCLCTCFVILETLGLVTSILFLFHQYIINNTNVNRITRLDVHANYRIDEAAEIAYRNSVYVRDKEPLIFFRIVISESG